MSVPGLLRKSVEQALKPAAYRPWVKEPFKVLINKVRDTFTPPKTFVDPKTQRTIFVVSMKNNEEVELFHQYCKALHKQPVRD